MHNRKFLQILITSISISIVSLTSAQESSSVSIEGLDQPVEILKDRWGISHIYAQTEHDLFFAQGYSAARDRLFQFEIWRAQATGTTAEILGPRALERDHGTRLFKFRGDMTEEMNHYHPRGAEIITAFVDGVNAYIDVALQDPDSLSLPFKLMGIQPKHWTPEVVISRHQGLLGNIGAELNTGRAVCAIGEDKVRELQYYHPHDPILELDPMIDCESLIQNDILGLYNAYRRGIRFQPSDLAVADNRNTEESFQSLAATLVEEDRELQKRSIEDIGSNNWVVSGDLTQNGWPMMINDPHRAQAVPSLRYWVHLVGPGWNVLGGGEPEIPGISIGHNEQGAWGLTVFNTDGEDLMVYEINPDNSNQYRYQGRWEDMRVIEETIEVKGASPVTVELKYTRHGPVSFEDEEKNLAYAVRPAWMDVGGAPYLASLRMDQATTWEEFREASNYSHIPGENMIWADRDGNIGWQAVGIAPLRRNFSGMVPVPGDGRFEWDGYLEIKNKPNDYNPQNGFIETSNSNYTPTDYPYLDAIGYTWTDPYRWARASEVLDSGRKFSMTDMVELQHDYLSIPARSLVTFFEDIRIDDPQIETARQMLLNWDFVLDKDSIEAGIYIAFERQLLENIETLKVPTVASDYLTVGMKTTIDMLLAPDGDFGSDPIAGRDQFLIDTLSQGVATLREKLGTNIEDWVYGQLDYKHVLLRHPLATAVNDEIRDRLNVGPVPRGGSSFTVGNTGSGDNQTSGASFRIFIDTRDWDNTLGMNTPGQVGDPDSPLYDNLFDLWANDRVFPAFYSREKIETVLYEKIDLIPDN
ncbi:MAG: penicillin acylase family protein [Gammaproteobacteria bacterium]|jgi:penicillin amidase|nr:penicillin acylase family protein [Gammaproteobacteria bacterium]MBT3860656.1 penicillin acylase family protein [Gammaproteobacteria bacterium]MBT3988793.1 penicillin acylase family protein [Gammaproteobacteria bacterium]MBT4255179.1 penicillin acylase family protein [Gammaproteobacteria bacterium]MBT4582656.1 penicillin acylase family protein [Gammaproteobacteria bacterium]